MEKNSNAAPGPIAPGVDEGVCVDNNDFIRRTVRQLQRFNRSVLSNDMFLTEKRSMRQWLSDFIVWSQQNPDPWND